MTLFLIFTGLVTVGIINIVLQNLAMQSIIPKNQVLSESDFLAEEKRTVTSRGTVSTLSSSTRFCPPIPILKPLKGLDDDLLDNLVSFCNQDYPDYEIIFCLEEANDPRLETGTKNQEDVTSQKNLNRYKRR